MVCGHGPGGVVQTRVRPEAALFMLPRWPPRRARVLLLAGAKRRARGLSELLARGPRNFTQD
eukprot:11163195-Lingulodinium_polyedra.AAC.1